MADINFIKARKKSRRVALQGLYSWQLSGNNIIDIEQFLLQSEHSSGLDVDYFKSLIHGIPENIEKIDKVYRPYLNLSPDKIDPMETNLLRIATYELIFLLDIPYKVIINESLDLTKKFGASCSYKFVNGVLDKLAQEVRSHEYC